MELKALAPDFSPHCFADRVSIYRDTIWATDALISIVEDGERTDLLDWANAAQYAIDTHDWSDLDFLIREQLEEETRAWTPEDWACHRGDLAWKERDQ